jgi:LTXXQ motif family protein
MKSIPAAIATAVVVAVCSATVAAAQGREWWRDPAVRQELRLSAEQVADLDAEFRRDLPRRRALHHDVEHVNAAFQQALADGNDERATELATRLVGLQEQQNKVRSRMLLRMSWVLTAEQRSQLRAILARRRP